VVLSKLDLAAAAALALALVGVEHDHRIIIGTPAAAEVAAKAKPICPDSDAVPFGADCLSFIGANTPAVAAAPNAVRRALAISPNTDERPALHDPPCPPSNENAPYSASCIRFLSGWYWQPDTAAPLP
jgi:hypothetical protein